MYKRTDAYILRVLTPLHVGSGDETYGIIDKRIQRDNLTGQPIIHSSSLKGALREYFNYSLNKGPLKAKANEFITQIFGSAPSIRTDEETSEAPANASFAKNKKGLFDFGFGYLLSFPVRCSAVPYVNATSLSLIEELKDQIEAFDVEMDEATANAIGKICDLARRAEKNKPFVFTSNLEGAYMEDYEVVGELESKPEDFELFQTILGKRPIIMHDDNMIALLERLPVIARNQLESGISQNLWYEEVVPRESRFFCTISPFIGENGQGEQDQTLASIFHQQLYDNNKPLRVQIGANATVGYGQTHFFPLSKIA